MHRFDSSQIGSIIMQSILVSNDLIFDMHYQFHFHSKRSVWPTWKRCKLEYQFQIRWVTFGARKCHSVPNQVGIGTRCELRVRELGTPSSSTESYCHRRPDLHSCPHFADLEIGVLRDYIVHEDAEKRRVMNLAGYYLHLGQGKWQPGQESSRQSHKSRPECSKTPWEIFHLRKQKFD